MLKIGYLWIVVQVRKSMVCASVRRDDPRDFSDVIIDFIGAQTMLYLTCTTISSADLAEYGVSLAKYGGICGLWYE